MSNEKKMNKYVVPSKRTAKKECIQPDLASVTSFPSLGVTAKATSWDNNKKTFTDTIHDLIALEQRTAEEREAAEEEAQKNKGIVVLKLPRSADEFNTLNQRIYEHCLKADKEYEMMELGMLLKPDNLSNTTIQEVEENDD